MHIDSLKDSEPLSLGCGAFGRHFWRREHIVFRTELSQVFQAKSPQCVPDGQSEHCSYIRDNQQDETDTAGQQAGDNDQKHEHDSQEEDENTE